MKKRILCLFLGLLLLSAPVQAAGGGNDPLISKSYVEETFLPRLRAGLQAVAERFVRAYAANLPASKAGLKTLRLAQGDTVSLSSGQQLTLLSGGVRLQLERGTLLNVSQGRTSTGGDARLANRYILCGDSAATAVATGPALVTVSVGAQVNAGPVASGGCPFTDVASGAWYYADVVSAYERGLVNGVTEQSFSPNGLLTMSQAMKLAACMHQLYHTGRVSLTPPASGPWYTPYVDYALKNGIAETRPTEYEVPITRGEFVKLFFNALPEKEYTKQNLIMDGAIPDVATDAPLAKQVYMFYEAGILTGYAADGTYLAHAFGPDSGITRAEVATIMNRMFTPSARIKFTMD